jgi:hypothetical protein
MKKCNYATHILNLNVIACVSKEREAGRKRKEREREQKARKKRKNKERWWEGRGGEGREVLGTVGKLHHRSQRVQLVFALTKSTLHYELSRTGGTTLITSGVTGGITSGVTSGITEWATSEYLAD